jgi:hypothetical protein
LSKSPLATGDFVFHTALFSSNNTVQDTILTQESSKSCPKSLFPEIAQDIRASTVSFDSGHTT